MTSILGAGPGLQCGVSPSRTSAGVARRSEWWGLAVDVVRDDRQWSASAGGGEVGRGSEVSACSGAPTGCGVFAARGASGAAFNPLDQCGDRERGWVGDEQVHVVGFCLERDELGVEFGADLADGVLAVDGHGVG